MVYFLLKYLIEISIFWYCTIPGMKSLAHLIFGLFLGEIMMYF